MTVNASELHVPQVTEPVVALEPMSASQACFPRWPSALTGCWDEQRSVGSNKMPLEHGITWHCSKWHQEGPVHRAVPCCGVLCCAVLCHRQADN